MLFEAKREPSYRQPVHLLLYCKREQSTEYSVFSSVTVPVWKQYILFCILINGTDMECKCLHCCWCPRVVCLKAGQMPLKQKQSWVATRAQPGNAFRPCLPPRMLLKISLFDYGPFIIILFGKHNVICSHKNYRVAQQKTNNLLALCLNEQPCCLPVTIHFTILYMQYQTHIYKHSYNTGNTLQMQYTWCRPKFHMYMLLNNVVGIKFQINLEKDKSWTCFDLHTYCIAWRLAILQNTSVLWIWDLIYLILLFSINV